MSMTGVGCSRQDLHTVFDHMGEYLQKNHTAVMVKDNSTQEIVSGILGMDYCYEYPEYASKLLSPRGKDLMEVLGWYKKMNQKNKEVEKKLNTNFYVFAGFTKEEYQNKRIYTTLNSIIESIAKEKGFKFMIRETGAPELIKILQKTGYREILKKNIESVDYGTGITVKVPEHIASRGENGIPYWVEFKKEF
jgi:hypothetical protein